MAVYSAMRVQAVSSEVTDGVDAGRLSTYTSIKRRFGGLIESHRKLPFWECSLPLLRPLQHGQGTGLQASHRPRRSRCVCRILK